MGLSDELKIRLMEAALAAAERGMAAGEVPIGAVIATGDGQIVASGYNQLNIAQDRTAHAEIVAFRAAAGRVDLSARDLIMVSTLEPCVMCFGAAMEAGVATVLFGLEAPADGGPGRVKPPESPESQTPQVIGGILADRSRALFEQWLAKNPNEDQAKFVRQLLSMV